MLRQALSLWKQEKKRKGTSLQRRLILFFAAVAVFIILTFTTLLLLSGVTGSGEKIVYSYTDGVLSQLRAGVDGDFGRLSVSGVSFAADMADVAEDFFRERGGTADELAAHPELLEPLLSEQIGLMLPMIERSSCSGVFVLLDASVRPESDDARAGIFLKKTQPGSVQSVGVKTHYLRGPAQIARDNGIELLGQWKMEYDISGQDFFRDVMDTARENPSLPLSRLYYWTRRVTLKGNSESGLLLCLPLRGTDGTVFGVCGVEISDRVFKQLYSPSESNSYNVFSVIAPLGDDALCLGDGMLAGNEYLTGGRPAETLTLSETRNGFVLYKAEDGGATTYGGLHAALRLYPTGSPYEGETWAVAVMLPQADLAAAITGRTPVLLWIALALLALSLGISFFISRRYLRPVTEAIDTIKSRTYSAGENTYLEINDLMEFLSRQDEEQRRHKPSLADPETDPTPLFEQFLRNVKTLSPAERSVFDLYIKGYKAQQIADELYLSINTIKTHNRRIFTKLNVSSRKELLLYIDMMREMDLLGGVQ